VGEPVSLSCPRCGAQNRPQASFCRECGSPLPAAGAGSEPLTTRPDPGPPIPTGTEDPSLGEGSADRSPISAPGPPVRQREEAFASAAAQTGAPPAQPVPGRRPRLFRNIPALTALILAVLALAAAVFVWFQLSDLQGRHDRVRADLQKTTDLLESREADLKSVRDEKAEVEESLAVCQEASETGVRFLDTSLQLYTAATRQQAGRIFRKMVGLSTEWERAMDDCLDQ
jgi:zinc-ribbon domain